MAVTVKNDLDSSRVINWNELYPLYKILNKHQQAEIEFILGIDDQTVKIGIKERALRTKFTASIQNYQDDKIKIEISVNEEIRNGSHNNGIENEIINPVKIYDNPEENIIEMRSAFDDDSVKFIPQEIIEIPCEMFDIIENAGNSKIYWL
ncbi:hypothetical protein C2G38_2245874 [Gigaspora rosea]|uniref:Uncharacterized protein n=1 Tax=Gigaspora rosea TaxID=44941 RepID=A0A397V8Q9_9GLOM|nr:hypothetical protein C2G38_2245874 [Gigaspora rosea]